MVAELARQTDEVAADDDDPDGDPEDDGTGRASSADDLPF